MSRGTQDGDGEGTRVSSERGDFAGDGPSSETNAPVGAANSCSWNQSRSSPAALFGCRPCKVAVVTPCVLVGSDAAVLAGRSNTSRSYRSLAEHEGRERASPSL